jgi:hypothetical protein
MAKYVAMGMSLVVFGVGMYAYLQGAHQAGGWTLFFSFFFMAWSVGRLLEEK